ncbi:lysophospholipid acyltransferase family protein [Wenzhouxiangella marina]|uniref:Uncharacterized protein n=1 Tax=Wenzhouxiangella marina TaxID=1579979 RepID=A0A0K0XSN8_9GAMM|nr:lysophospholipid acyltransferase family protein [Wenzhouxiangella marina]AKS40709.1 hypothetical protein WM2015_326 [Wenzhouxiangella marina]MBB6088482.1 KDO2-lipid IV(A) lauroyltransferase [Wenzhouxiangella marina]
MLFLARLLIRLLALLPLKLLYGLAVPLAALGRLRRSRKARIIDTNLALAFPESNDEERQALRRAHEVEMIRLALETGAVWHWPARRIESRIRSVEGLEALEQARADGRGVLFLSGHLGNWEILTLYLSLQVPLVALYKAPRDARLQRAITDSRERFGGRLVASGSPAMRTLLRQLRQGQGAGLLIDQQPKQGEGRFVDFFGHPALTMTLPYRLSQRTGCRIVLSECTREPGGRGWAIRLEAAPEAAYSEDSETALTTLNDWLAERVKAHPAQYLWRYKRFDLQPDNGPSPYRRRD